VIVVVNVTVINNVIIDGNPICWPHNNGIGLGHWHYDDMGMGEPAMGMGHDGMDMGMDEWLMADRQMLQIGEMRRPASSLPSLGTSLLVPFLIVFFSGANLILIQWVLVHEMTTLPLGTELVVLLISVSYFVGVSIGYLLSRRIGRRWLTFIGTATLILHLTLPITFRLLVAWLGDHNAYAAAFLVLPLLTPFVVSMFYSVFLPHFVDAEGVSLRSLYAVELLGTICGIGVLVFLANLGIQVVYAIYTAGLITVLLVVGIRRWLAALLIAASVLWLFMFPTLNNWSNVLWYTKLLGFPENTTVLYSGYSPYQKVDVLQLPDGGRALYLDGLEHFNGSAGIRLNVIVGEVPALLIQPANSLVIGAGAMQTEQLIAATGGRVTTVELDPVVADVGARFFYAYNQMDVLTNRSVVVDDAKHFLANSANRYDLIVGDTPAAFSIQPATLYSVPFYQTVHDHLTHNGIFVGNLTSPLIPGDTIASRVTASLLKVFKQVIVVTPASVGWSFAFAGDHLPFTIEQLQSALRQNGELQSSVFDTSAVGQLVGRTPPITLDTMDFVLQTSAQWIRERLLWGQE
jgi:spermidine synthase